MAQNQMVSRVAAQHMAAKLPIIDISGRYREHMSADEYQRYGLHVPITGSMANTGTTAPVSSPRRAEVDARAYAEEYEQEHFGSSVIPIGIIHWTDHNTYSGVVNQVYSES